MPDLTPAHHELSGDELFVEQGAVVVDVRAAQRFGEQLHEHRQQFGTTFVTYPSPPWPDDLGEFIEFCGVFNALNYCFGDGVRQFRIVDGDVTWTGAMAMAAALHRHRG